MGENFLTVICSWAVFLGIIYFLINSRKIYAYIVGKAGEKWTREELNKLDNSVYTVLEDVMIKIGDTTCQIDFIVVSDYGIFVIETKQYNGDITGGRYDKKWVRHFYKKKYYYTNPIRQNYGHIKSLCELLKLQEDKFFNVVHIPSKGKINIKDGIEIVRYGDLVNRISKETSKIIDNKEEITDILKSNNIVAKEARKKHVESVKSKIVHFDDTMCPRCGGSLVKREGKYGPFYGCSNYPKCKYIKKMSK